MVIRTRDIKVAKISLAVLQFYILAVVKYHCLVDQIIIDCDSLLAQESEVVEIHELQRRWIYAKIVDCFDRKVSSHDVMHHIVEYETVIPSEIEKKQCTGVI